MRPKQPSAEALRQVDRDVLAWCQRHGAGGRREHARDAGGQIEKDATRLLQHGRADVPAFEEEALPVGEAEFNRLEALLLRLEDVQSDRILLEHERKKLATRLQRAVLGVTALLPALRERVRSLGFGLGVLRFKSASQASAWGPLQDGERVVVRLDALLEQDPNPTLTAARKSLTAALDALRGLLRTWEALAAREAVALHRLAALHALLAEHCHFLARWGRLLPKRSGLPGMRPHYRLHAAQRTRQ